nr:MAG: RNA-dependent RNA polymerase [Agrocybe praecox orthocurvulavirus 1]
MNPTTASQVASTSQAHLVPERGVKRKAVEDVWEEEEWERQVSEMKTDDLLSYIEEKSSYFDYTASGSYHPRITTGSSRRYRLKKNAKRFKTESMANKNVEALAKRFSHITVGYLPEPQLTDDRPLRRRIREVMKFAEPDPTFLEFLEEEKPEMAPFDPTEWCMATTNDWAQMHHLKYYDYDPKEPSAEVLARLDLAVGYIDMLLKPDVQIEFPRKVDMAGLRFRPGKYPGYEYRVQGYRTRQQAHEVALKDAEEAWDRLMEGKLVEPHMVRMGGRGKAVHKSEEAVREAGVPKGRLILMLSHRDFLLCGNTEQRLNDYLKDFEHFVSVGDSWYLGGTSKMHTLMDGHEKYICFDAEKFDSSIRPFLISRAVTSVRKLFVNGLNKKYDNYWKFVERTMYETVIIRDDGIVLRKYTGTTSGHNHNSVLQSIITGYCLVYGIICARPATTFSELFEGCSFKTLGDDTLLALRKQLSELSMRHMAELVKRDLFINWLGDKSYTCYSFAEPEVVPGEFPEGGEFESVQYLGKYFTYDTYASDSGDTSVCIPFRPFSETARQLYMPEKPVWVDPSKPLNAYQVVYRRTLGIALDCMGNPRTRLLINRYLDWLEARGGAKECEWTEETVQRLGHDYSETSSTVVFKCRRYSKEEWLDLVVQKADLVERFYGHFVDTESALIEAGMYDVEDSDE